MFYIRLFIIIIITVYVFAVYALPHLHNLWTNTCGLVGVAHAFGLVGHACTTNEVWKVWEGRQRVRIMLKVFLRMRVHFRTAQNVKTWPFIKTTTCCTCFTRLCCCSLSYSSFLMQTRWGCIYTLSSPPFLCQAPSSSLLPSQLLPFWHCDNETASAATALRTINLRKCIQLFVNRIF